MAHKNTPSSPDNVHRSDMPDGIPEDRKRLSSDQSPPESSSFRVDEVDELQELYEQFLTTQHFSRDTEAESIAAPEKTGEESQDQPNVLLPSPRVREPQERPPSPNLFVSASNKESEELLIMTQRFKALSEEEEIENNGHGHAASELPIVDSQNERDQVDWKVGQIIDERYEVKEIIGWGGMGIVYKVHHRGWDLDLAVKMPLRHLIANQRFKNYINNNNRLELIKSAFD